MILVREEGLEPSHPKALTPEASASTNSATLAHYPTIFTCCQQHGLVRKEGLEPSHPKALTPEASASTNSATFASGRHSTGSRKHVNYQP